MNKSDNLIQVPSLSQRTGEVDLTPRWRNQKLPDKSNVSWSGESNLNILYNVDILYNVLCRKC